MERHRPCAIFGCTLASPLSSYGAAACGSGIRLAVRRSTGPDRVTARRRPRRDDCIRRPILLYAPRFVTLFHHGDLRTLGTDGATHTDPASGLAARSRRAMLGDQIQQRIEFALSSCRGRRHTP